MCEESYLSDCSSAVSRPACYDASASDTDSGDSELELSSNASAVWSPTIRRRARSDSGSTATAEERLSRIDKYLREGGGRSPVAVTSQLDHKVAETTQQHQQRHGEDRGDNYGQVPCEEVEADAVVDKSVSTQPPQQRRQSRRHNDSLITVSRLCYTVCITSRLYVVFNNDTHTA